MYDSHEYITSLEAKHLFHDTHTHCIIVIIAAINNVSIGKITSLFVMTHANTFTEKTCMYYWVPIK